MTHLARISGLAAGFMLFGNAAMAQSDGTITTQTDVGSRKGSLSDRLNATSGVIHPQDNVDPGIHREAPATGNMPVIRPPSASGDGSAAQPK